MRFFDLFSMAFSGIFVHKNRSILTVLGIVIGITSVTAVMSIGQSAENLVVGEIQRFGPSNVFVLPGRQPNGPTDVAGTLLNDSLKLKDFEDMQKKENIPEAQHVIPYVFGFVSSSFGSETYDAMMIGSTDYAQKNFDLSVQDGRFFDEVDVEQKDRAVVLGSKIKDELFGNAQAIGEKIKVKDQKFTVIGVLAPEGQGSFVDFNKAIIGPYTSVQQNILGAKYFNRIIVDAVSVDAVPGVIRDIKTLLRNNHNIDDPEKDDFFIQTQEDLADRIKTVTSILTVLLASVAAISLIVGGVGIMNIMLASVTERTKEIGLRKSLGATNNNILFQFLLEALFLTLTGGFFGIVFGALLTWGLTEVAQKFAGIILEFSLSTTGIILALFVSISIGIGFGLFPALKASRKNPVESLYYYD